MCTRWTVGLVLVLAVSSASADDTGTDARAAMMAARQQAVAEARRLAKDVFLTPQDLGPGWKLPWEVPVGTAMRAPSEDEFWARRELFPVGLSPEVAQTYVDHLLPQYEQQLAAEAKRNKTPAPGTTGALAVLLLNTRGAQVEPAVDLRTALATMSEMMNRRLAHEQAGGQGRFPGDQHFFEVMTAPWTELGEDALRARLLRALTAVERQTELVYLESNDWSAFGPGVTDEDLARKKVWLGNATIRVLVAGDEEDLQDVPDLDAAACRSLEAEVNGYLENLRTKAKQVRRLEHQRNVGQLEKSIHELQVEIGEDPHKGYFSGADRRLAILEERLERARRAYDASEPTEFDALSVRVYVREYGDACHVVRLLGTPPPSSGLAAQAAYAAWVRAGNVAVDVRLSGSLPVAELDPTMDRLLGALSIAAENLAD